MRVLVLGAAGRTGQEVVSHAVAAGHTVTALVHHGTIHSETAGVRVLHGDAQDPETLSNAVDGQDAVIDTIASTDPWKETHLETTVAHNVIAAMKQHGARRLLVVSAMGVGDSAENAGPVYRRLLMPTYLRGIMADKAAMESEVQVSDLDWVILRPAILTNDEEYGKVRTYDPTDHDTAHKIPRADLGRFLVEQLTSDLYLGKAVTIAIL